MRMRNPLLLAPVLLLPLTACLNDATDPNCQQVPTLVTETRGDTAVTVTGLRYIETRAGTGDPAVACKAVAITYRGSLTDGTEFDDGPLQFVPGYGRYLSGFEQGVVGMKVGGTRRLIIPPNLGYGAFPPTGSGIPVNATLIFDIELFDVE